MNEEENSPPLLSLIRILETEAFSDVEDVDEGFALPNERLTGPDKDQKPHHMPLKLI